MSTITDINAEIGQFVRRHGWCEDDGYQVIAIPSTINGYHAHRVTPLSGVDMPLECTREHNNRYSRYAVLVSTPAASTLPASIRSKETRLEGRDVSASAVCGKACGRMPRELSDILAPAMDRSLICKMKAFYLGEMEHGGNVRGGGAKLKCVYVVKARPGLLNEIEGYNYHIIN